MASPLVKNRRLAHLAILERDDFFAEAEMRERQPVLYSTVVGRFSADLSIPDPADAAQHAVSHALLRKLDSRRADAQLEEELRRTGEVEADSDEEEAAAEESDDEEAVAGEGEEEESAEVSARRARAAARAEAHATRLAEFRRLMRERVLLGEETEVDYAKVDADETLDDLRTVGQDAEAAYFDED